MKQARWFPLCSLLCAALLSPGCGVDEEAQFAQDYVEDYETDAADEAAEAEEFAALEVLEDPEADVPLADDGEDPEEGRLGQALSVGGSPLSIMEDDPHFSGEVVEEWAPCGRKRSRFDEAAARAALQEAKALGVDIIRVMVGWDSVLPCEARGQAQRPAGLNTLDPASYDWRRYDTQVRLAQELGLRVLITVAGPFPRWASEDPERCADGPCTWRPRRWEYARFIHALGAHFRALRRESGKAVWGWTLWNEPNHPGFLQAGGAEATGRAYRGLWFTGLRHLRLADCARFGRDAERRRICARSRNARVLFGDLANDDDLRSDDPTPEFLGAALCRSCPRVVYTRGVAFHPYARRADSARTPAAVAEAITALRARVDDAEQDRRLPRGRGLYMTEAAVRTQRGMVPLSQQAGFIDRGELLQAGLGVKTVAQYELYDEGRAGFETGLRFADANSPAWLPYQRYLCYVSANSGPVDAECQKACNPPCAPGGHCEPCQDMAGKDLPGDAMTQCQAEQLPILQRCNQGAQALAGQPKPGYAAYQLAVTARRAGDDLELRVLSRVGPPRGTLLVHGTLASGQEQPVGVVQVDARGYGAAGLPVEGLRQLRIEEPFTKLSRTLAVP